MTTEEPVWGRLLIAGGTDFAVLGRTKSNKTIINESFPDLGSVHLMRNVLNVKFKKIIASHSGCHAVFIDIENRAWLIGRNEHYQLSHPLPLEYTSPHNLTDGTESDSPSVPYPILLNSLRDENVSRELKEQGIVNAAVSRNHTILVTERGQVWTAGWNSLGQCGHPNLEDVTSFKKVAGLETEKIISASAGLTFSLFLSESGKVYSVGSGEKGQLGNGKTGEYIASSKVFFLEQFKPELLGGGLEGKKIISICSGQQHSVAMDDEGFVYSWGFGGLGRLGMGAQFDVLIPTIIPSFSGSNILTRATKITCGATNTSFIDGQGMYHLAGKWKTSGDGSAGQPWMSPKLVQEIQGYKWHHIGSGSVTLLASTNDEKEGNFTVSWGQGAANGELAQGEDSLKSAAKPIRIEALDDVTIIDIAAGQNTTFFLARPPSIKPKQVKVVKEMEKVDIGGFGYGFDLVKPIENLSNKVIISNGFIGESRTFDEKWESMERYPDLLEQVGENCIICDLEGEDALLCEKCDKAYHGNCLEIKVIGIPDGEWFCPNCCEEPIIGTNYPIITTKRKVIVVGATKSKKQKV